MIRSTKLPVVYRTSFSGKLDRLSSLIDRLRVHVENALSDQPNNGFANLVIYSDAGGANRLIFCPSMVEEEKVYPDIAPLEGEIPLVAAHISISSSFPITSLLN